MDWQLTMCGDSLRVDARTGFVWVGPELLGLISGVRTLSVDHWCPPLSQAPLSFPIPEVTANIWIIGTFSPKNQYNTHEKIIFMFCWGWCWPVIRWEQEKFHVCPRFYGWLVFLELAAIRQSPSWLLTAGSRYHFISFDYHHIWETAPSEILIWLTKNNTQCRKLWPPPLVVNDTLVF